MKSSSGYYSSRLDHVRGLAAFIVCYWHFVHLKVPTHYVPSFFPLSVLEEGHTGVALFMTLSGFLFARITGDREINVFAFARNRFLRLAPLLFVVFAMSLMLGQTTLLRLAQGFVLPVWPGVTWSIAPEIHFYLLFPMLLLVARKFGSGAIVLLICLAIGLRFALWKATGEVQVLAYLTIVGRVDQFLWGFLFGLLMSKRGFAALGEKNTGYLTAGVLLCFLIFWHWFNSRGGYYHLLNSYPSPSPLWIVLPSIEGLTYAFLIAWYSAAAIKIPQKIDRLLAVVGTVSFSIYVWHWTMLEPVAALFDRFELNNDGFHSASFLALVFFLLVVIVSIGSYRWIERPFLSLRVNYFEKPKLGGTGTNVPRNA